jgi:hypothetical protein
VAVKLLLRQAGTAIEDRAADPVPPPFLLGLKQ